MDSPKGKEIEARLASVEESIAALQRRLDALMVERREARHAGWAYRSFGLGKREPIVDPLSEGRAAGTPQPAFRRNVADEICANISSCFASRSPEWWLSRVRIGLMVLAVLILYGYAIAKGWIT